MEPQHFILCWSCVIADMQSANCRPNRATMATIMSSLFVIYPKSTLTVLDARVNERIQRSRTHTMPTRLTPYIFLLNIRPQMGYLSVTEEPVTLTNHLCERVGVN